MYDVSSVQENLEIRVSVYLRKNQILSIGDPEGPSQL